MEQGGIEAESGRALPTVTRILSHGAVWIAVLVPMFVVLTHGWTAGGDFAAISIRAFQNTGLQTPLVGMLSTAGSVGHNISDPGPALFRLLAIPVHIDPAHGALWGAALLGGAAMSVAVEATWSTGRWLGCAIIGFCALDLVWLVPQVFETLMWNAYFPIPFLLATIVVAWVVCMGGYGWWPVLVATASIAAQSHLFFVLPCVPLVIVAPIAALWVAGRPHRLRWLLIGIVVGVASWLAPLLQNLYAQGNLTAILRGSNGKTLGIAFGLRAVATAASPWPIWLKHEPSGYFGTLAFLHANRPLSGFIVLALLAVIALASWRGGHRSLTSLALVALICSIGFTVSLTHLSREELAQSGLSHLWPLGPRGPIVDGGGVGGCTGDSSGGSPLQFVSCFDTPARLSMDEHSWCGRGSRLADGGFCSRLAISVRQGEHD